MKIIIAFVFICCCFTRSHACDICGCGVGATYLGVLPDFHKKIFGLRYRCNSLVTHLGAGSAATYLTTNETYSTVEAWGGWNLSEKWRIMAAVPYNFIAKKNQGLRSSKSGLGDVNASIYYLLINSKKAAGKDKLLAQTLWIGGGIKLPAGQYKPEDKELSSQQNSNLFQLGTGSVDFTLNAMYDIRLQDAGLNISAAYKINTANKYQYGYGNKLNTATQLYYKFRIKNKFTIAPNAGLMYEQSQKDLDDNIFVYSSGGNLLAATVGVETAFKKIAVGANWQAPLSQNLAHNFVKANSRAMLHFSFLL